MRNRIPEQGKDWNEEGKKAIEQLAQMKAQWAGITEFMSGGP
jgi:hypothetical protein